MGSLNISNETGYHIALICAVLFFLILAVNNILKQLQIRREKSPSHSLMFSSLHENLFQYKWYQNHVKDLEEKVWRLYPLGVPEEYTAEHILNNQVQNTFMILGATIAIYVVFRIFIVPLVGFGLVIYALVMKESEINKRLKAKEADFDIRLPQFQNSLLMGLNAGASLSKAMELAITSMLDCPSKQEFELLWTQTKTSTSDQAFPYLELAKRIKTKDCDQFTNQIINGLKNGTSMSQILEENSKVMLENMKNRIKEKNEKNSTSATVYTTAFVLMPLIVVLLAPLIMTSM